VKVGREIETEKMDVISVKFIDLEKRRGRTDWKGAAGGSDGVKKKKSWIEEKQRPKSRSRVGGGFQAECRFHITGGQREGEL